jgi:hypothetical protein
MLAEYLLALRPLSIAMVRRICLVDPKSRVPIETPDHTRYSEIIEGKSPGQVVAFNISALRHAADQHIVEDGCILMKFVSLYG